MVRRLPVLQNADDEAARRPRWHYVLIGAGFTVTFWLPLAMLANWLGQALALRALDVDRAELAAQALARASEAQRRWAFAAQALPLVLSFFLACLASSTLVGRFGADAGTRQSILGNLLASAVVVGLAALGGGVSLVIGATTGTVLGLISLIAGLWGARLGKRLRPGLRLDSSAKAR